MTYNFTVFEVFLPIVLIICFLFVLILIFILPSKTGPPGTETGERGPTGDPASLIQSQQLIQIISLSDPGDTGLTNLTNVWYQIKNRFENDSSLFINSNNWVIGSVLIISNDPVSISGVNISIGCKNNSTTCFTSFYENCNSGSPCCDEPLFFNDVSLQNFCLLISPGQAMWMTRVSNSLFTYSIYKNNNYLINE